MIYDPNDPSVRLAIFGKQVEDFLTSDIGDYLLKYARQQETDGVEQLLRVNPWRRRRIQVLQNQIATAQNFQRWLGEAVAAGQMSLAQLQGEE